MLPVIALVGRPNVGKSTLFNCLTRSRDAIVADQPGLTRDRQFGVGYLGERRHVIVDTGGLVDDTADALTRQVVEQTMQAVAEADVVVFMVDAREGLTAADEEISARLRRTDKPLLLAANKVDGTDPDTAVGEFFSLGLGTPHALAAAHRRGVRPVLEAALDLVPVEEQAPADDSTGVKIAFVGRPNVGKSTLVNRITGSNRVVTDPTAGTTRDAIEVPFERHGKQYTLVDTAGIRRRSRVFEKVEKFSVVKAIQAIEQCDVVVLVLDGVAGVADQDMTLVGHVLEAGRAVTIAVNKWDALDADQRQGVRAGLARKLTFLDFANQHHISALHGTGIGQLLRSVDRAYASARAKLSTPELTRTLADAVTQTPPPVVRGRRIRLRYAHQGGSGPPRVVIHGNQTAAVPESYRRYLARVFRERFKLTGTPLVVEFRTSNNPFKGRRNTLTPRQRRKRERMMRHVKGRR